MPTIQTSCDWFKNNFIKQVKKIVAKQKHRKHAHIQRADIVHLGRVFGVCVALVICSSLCVCGHFQREMRSASWFWWCCNSGNGVLFDFNFGHKCVNNHFRLFLFFVPFSRVILCKQWPERYLFSCLVGLTTSSTANQRFSPILFLIILIIKQRRGGYAKTCHLCAFLFMRSIFFRRPQ